MIFILLIFCINFSVSELKYVTFGNEFSDKGKIGQKYASKEKLYLLNMAFMVPKSSPLKARSKRKASNAFINKIHNFRKTFNLQFLLGWKLESARI